MMLVPRFRSSSYIAALSDTNFGSKGALAAYLILVPLIDLKFLKELVASDAGTSNRRHQCAGDGGEMLEGRRGAASCLNREADRHARRSAAAGRLDRRQ